MSDIKPKLFSTDGHQWGCGINSSLCESTCAFQVALPSINRSTCTVLHGLIFNGLILFSVLVGAQSQQAVGQCVVHSGQFTSASLGHILRPAFMVSGENAKGYELNNVDSVWPVFVCVCFFFFSQIKYLDSSGVFLWLVCEKCPYSTYLKVQEARVPLHEFLVLLFSTTALQNGGCQCELNSSTALASRLKVSIIHLILRCGLESVSVHWVRFLFVNCTFIDMLRPVSCQCSLSLFTLSMKDNVCKNFIIRTMKLD